MSKWIDWAGGPCPVKDSVPIQVVLRAVPNPSEEVLQPQFLRWHHTGGGGDIVAYRALRKGDAIVPSYQPYATAVSGGGSAASTAADTTGYGPLADVLQRAYYQAAGGKGKERHAQGKPFVEQPMQELISLYGLGFALGQAGKKAQESQRLPREKAVHELLGAIVYLAGAVVALEAEKRAENRDAGGV